MYLQMLLFETNKIWITHIISSAECSPQQSVSILKLYGDKCVPHMHWSYILQVLSWSVGISPWILGPEWEHLGIHQWVLDMDPTFSRSILWMRPDGWQGTLWVWEFLWSDQGPWATHWSRMSGDTFEKVGSHYPHDAWACTMMLSLPLSLLATTWDIFVDVVW